MAEEGLKKWFSRNKGKGWVDCKTGKPCGHQKGEKRKDIQLVGQRWLNVQMPQKRKQGLNVLVGKMIE